MDPEDEVMATGGFKYLLAGAAAGSCEHTGMYPLDTIKTHLQSSTSTRPAGMMQISRNIYARSGISGFFRGVTAIAAGAAPSHAVYFLAYERLRHLFQGSILGGGLAGAGSTIMADLILVPMDTIKQRRQLSAQVYRNNLHCMKKIIRIEGSRALFAGYTTTLAMNIPFHSVYVSVYEACRQRFHSHPDEYNPMAHVVSGAIGGSIASAITNPLDVIRTRLQTAGDTGQKFSGMLDVGARIFKEEGLRGYSRGIVPRMVFNACSAAILWTSYEYFKFVLGVKNST